MAIAVDSSSPAAATGSTATTTTAAFTPPANSAIFAFAQGDANNGSNDEALTVSDNVSGTWARVVQNNGNGGAVSEIWYRLCITSPGSMTVSVTDNKGSVAKRLFVRVYTGTDLTLPYGATTSGTTAAVSYNSTVADSWGWSCGLTSNATITAGANCNLEDEAGGFDSGDAVFTLSRTATTPTPGTSVTLTESGGTCFHHVAVEIVPPAPAGVPYNPQHSIQTRDYGEVPWLQRDRRDANTVSTAANPLASPLDTAWQASARYWHLYGDVAERDSRVYFYQRPAMADTAAAAGAVQYVTARSAQPRDAGEVPWLQRRASDPTLLNSAQLENELLGGADTTRHSLTAATHAPRWWMPQQPKREATTPGLLDSALLEAPLLVEATKRTLPATHADRREVPQQRAYISDPSFYPTVPPTDPLTLAWGVGGTYWLIYNTAAVTVDRRDVPQQRAYVSDPSLLATALLEGPLLGSADTARHAHPALYADRREVPQQRVYISHPTLLATALLEGVLLGGADAARHGHAAVYTDRREVPPQRAYVSDPSFYPVATAADPLLVAWGVGGRYWLMYYAAAYVDRGDIPRQVVGQPPRWTVFTTDPVVPAGLVGEAHGPESLPTGAITSHTTALAGGVT